MLTTVRAASAAAEPVVELDEMLVTASADASAEGLRPVYAGGQVATGGRVGLLGSMDFLSTPFSLTSYTQELIENQQSASVGEVLLNDPAVRVARGFGNFQQLYMVRGLPVYSDDMAYNGLYGLLPRQYLAAELVERVEVLRGANAFLNGAAPGGSGLGGAVNVMPKRAPNGAVSEVTAGVQSGGQIYGAVDLARRLAGERFGVRFNGVRRDGDTAVDGESSELALASVGLDWWSDVVRVSADLGWQDFDREASQPSITIGGGIQVPDAPRASRSVAQPWTYSDERDLFATIRTEVDLTEGLVLWAAAGVREGEEENSFANPTVVAADGTSSSYRFDNVREDHVATGEVGLRASFATAGVGHRVVASAAAYALDSDNAYAFSSFAGFAGDIYAPFAVVAPAADFFVGGSLAAPLRTERVRTSSVALADVISFADDRLMLTLGVRRQKIESDSYDYDSGARLSSYSESRTTPVAGVVYRFASRVSGYANYIEGLSKGDTAPATSGGTAVVNAGDVLRPYVTEQIEVGAKFDFGRLGTTVGVFQSEKPIAGVGSDGVFRVLDHQRNRGVEFTAFGEPVSGVRLLGGASFLDTDVAGNDSIGAPTWQVNTGVEWAPVFLPGFVLDGRMIHTDEQFANAANTQRVPSWTRFDFGARWRLDFDDGRALTVRARVENLLDRDYWASAGGYPGAGYLTVGGPRTLVVSGTLSF
ncbi:TonB-dependent siderophore receptor [Opitutales bacterium ASA1]|nr:TonB-dependent siderophore receptor [Opitutales bacterium ASA1]